MSYRSKCGNARKAYGNVEAGKHKGDQPHDVDEHHDSLLFAYLFLELHPSLDQLWIVSVEIGKSEETGDKTNQEVDPTLPKPQRASGNEQQSSQHT